MLSARQVAQSPHFAIHEVECSDHDARWSSTEWSNDIRLVLVRRGTFRRRHRGQVTTIDTTTGYLQRPGDEEQFAHPAGGDLCTSITLLGGALMSEPWLRSALATTSPPNVRVDSRLELAHRRLLRSRHETDSSAAEALVDLLMLTARATPDSPAPGPGRRELAERAREAIVADHPCSASLVALATLVDTTPSHLSRTFRHHVGSSVSAYRNRVRISRALALIDDGETDLAALASHLGFSDQAHLTRVMRDALGHSPGQVRTMLSSA